MNVSKNEIVQQNENHVYAHYCPEFVGLKRKKTPKSFRSPLYFLTQESSE